MCTLRLWPGSHGSFTPRERWPASSSHAPGGRRVATCRGRGGAGLKSPEVGGWPVIGPSAVAFDEGNPVPTALDEAGIDGVVAAFEAAARRALSAGFRLIEITRPTATFCT